MVLGDDGEHPGSCSGSLGDALVHELGPVGCSCDEDSLGREVYGPELLVGLEVESVLAYRDLDHLGEVFLLLAHRSDSDGQGEGVHGDRYGVAEDGVVRLHEVAVVLGQLVLALAAEEPDSELAGLVVEVLAEGVGPDVLVDDGDVGGRVVHLDLDGVPDRTGAADTAAVADLLVPGTDALDEDDVLSGELSGSDLLLELHIGEDLGVGTVVVLDRLVLCGSDCEQNGSCGDLLSALQLDDEVTDVSGDVHDLGLGVDFDLGAVLDLLDGLGEVLGHELSVLLVDEVPGESSELGVPLEEVDLYTLGCDVEGGGHTGDSSSDDCCGLGDGDLCSLERLEEACLGDCHPYEVLRLHGCGLGRVHVDPRALVADVRHVVEVLVETSVPAGLPEERLVGPGGAGGYDDPVQVVLGDGLADLVEGVLGAGVFGLGCEDDVREGLGVLGDLGDVDDGSDVDTAVADPYSDAGLLSCDILLCGVDLGLARLELGVVDDERTGLCGGTGCLCDGGRDVLGCCEGTGDEDSLPGGLERVEDGGLGESVLVQLDTEGLGEVCRSLRTTMSKVLEHASLFLSVKLTVTLWVSGSSSTLDTRAPLCMWIPYSSSALLM